MLHYRCRCAALASQPAHSALQLRPALHHRTHSTPASCISACHHASKRPGRHKLDVSWDGAGALTRSWGWLGLLAGQSTLASVLVVLARTRPTHSKSSSPGPLNLSSSSRPVSTLTLGTTGQCPHSFWKQKPWPTLTLGTAARRPPECSGPGRPPACSSCRSHRAHRWAKLAGAGHHQGGALGRGAHLSWTARCPGAPHRRCSCTASASLALHACMFAGALVGGCVGVWVGMSVRVHVGVRMHVGVRVGPCTHLTLIAVRA